MIESFKKYWNGEVDFWRTFLVWGLGVNFAFLILYIVLYDIFGLGISNNFPVLQGILAKYIIFFHSPLFLPVSAKIVLRSVFRNDFEVIKCILGVFYTLLSGLFFVLITGFLLLSGIYGILFDQTYAAYFSGISVPLTIVFFLLFVLIGMKPNKERQKNARY